MIMQAKKCSGWKQVELNELWKKQAKNLGEVNKNIDFDVIFTSDLIRSIDSADIAFPNVKKIQDKRLRECNYGNLDGEDKHLIVYKEHILDNEVRITLWFYLNFDIVYVLALNHLSIVHLYQS